MKRYAGLFVVFMIATFTNNLQAQVVDQIVAIVGDDIILQSDIDNQYAYYIANGQTDDGTLRCALLENLLVNKLLLNKAKIDSLTVGEDQVKGEVNRRVTIFSQQAGGEDKLEEIYGKSIIEIKAEVEEEIENQLLIDQEREKILNSITITPREVKEFYKKIPKDSLPFLPAEVELHHIVIKPPFSESSREKAEKRLSEIRDRIVNQNEDFATMALEYSMGPSGKVGGSLGEFGRGQMVPEFDDIIFNLREGEVSKLFWSPFGCHIAKLHQRLGDKVNASHILIIPERGIEDEMLAKNELNRIRKMIEDDEISFEKAAVKYSQDNPTKDCGGCIKNPQTGEMKIPLDILDADLFFKVDNMKVGEISDPQQLIQPGSTDILYHILYLQSKVPPHVANLKDDYQKLHAAALQSKQSTRLEKWFESSKKNIFIDIKDRDCLSALKNWKE